MLSSPINSSNLSYAWFDTDGLTLEFKNGTQYLYPAVTQTIYDNLIKADSAGKYFHANIKDKFAFVKVEKLKSKS